MKTDIIAVSSEGNNIEAALELIDRLIDYKKLSPKNAVSLRLLAEEMMAMMRAIAGNVNGEFWVEDRDQVYELHLLVRSLVSDDTRKKLLSASTSGKNEAGRGLMGKIRSFFEVSGGVPMLTAGFSGGSPKSFESCSWSMDDYRDQLRQYRESKDRNEAWDELEKSVVGRVADNVKVSIRGKTVEMTVIKKMV